MKLQAENCAPKSTVRSFIENSISKTGDGKPATALANQIFSKALVQMNSHKK